MHNVLPVCRTRDSTIEATYDGIIQPGAVDDRNERSDPERVANLGTWYVSTLTIYSDILIVVRTQEEGLDF